MVEEVRQAWHVKMLILVAEINKLGSVMGAHRIGTHFKKVDDHSEVGSMGCRARF